VTTNKATTPTMPTPLSSAFPAPPLEVLALDRDVGATTPLVNGTLDAAAAPTKATACCVTVGSGRVVGSAGLSTLKEVTISVYLPKRWGEALTCQ